jgi:aryl-alcohol dehydrogenase-like predicted oxidoreductase
MQLTGPYAFGPTKDPDEGIAVLREAVERGITHIDTADFYGPFVVNELIREALYPYPAGLRIVTKVGARRGDDGSFILPHDPKVLKAEVHENLQRLGVDALDVVNLRLGTPDGQTDTESIGDRFGALAELREEGLIRHLGLSVVSDAQLTEAQAIAPVVTVQNLYNLAIRQDDALVERCATENIAFAAFFPLGGFTPLQSQDPDRHRRAPVGHAPTGGPGLAVAAFAHHRPHPRHLLPGPPAREHRRGGPGAADGRGSRTRHDRSLTRAQGHRAHPEIAIRWISPPGARLARWKQISLWR